MDLEYRHLRKIALPLLPAALPRRLVQPFSLNVDAEFVAMLLGSHRVGGEGEVRDEDKTKGYFTLSGSLPVRRPGVHFDGSGINEEEMRANLLRLLMNGTNTKGGHARHHAGEAAARMRLEF